MSSQTKLEMFIARAQKEIAYCLNCQTRDSGDWIWVFGIRMTMDDLFRDLDIPEKYWTDVAESLVCPNCHTELAMDYDIGIKSKEEIENEKTWDKMQKKWRTLYHAKIEDFYKYLEKYPYIGLEHKLGKEIFKKLTKFPKHNIKKEKWFRARSVDNSKRLHSKDMYPPDPNKIAVPEGRFNHFGQSVFYLAESLDGAVKEKLDEDEHLVWIQPFDVEASNILDLTPDFVDGFPDNLDILVFGFLYMNTILDHSVTRSAGWKPEYFIPRYIADCARVQGYNGVMFKGTKYYSNNLVVFSWTDNMIKPVGKPALYAMEKDVVANVKVGKVINPFS